MEAQVEVGERWRFGFSSGVSPSILPGEDSNAVSPSRLFFLASFSFGSLRNLAPLGLHAVIRGGRNSVGFDLGRSFRYWCGMP